MNTRLESIKKELFEKLKDAGQKKQERAGIIACELAFREVPVNVPIVVESLERLRCGHKLTAQQLIELADLATELDELYFDLLDKAENHAGSGLNALLTFSQARVVSALSFAGKDNLLISVAEAIYEACSAVNDSESIFETIFLVLSETNDG